MSKENVKSKPSGEPKSTGTLPGKPTREQVREWTRADLNAAHYFLGMLRRYPELVDELADSLYEKANSSEGGAAIDQVAKTAEA